MAAAVAAAAATAEVLPTGGLAGCISPASRAGVTYALASTHSQRSAFRGKVMLLFAREMKAIAEEIAALSRGKIVLGEIEWSRFPDSFPNLRLENSSAMPWVHCAFLTSLHSPDVIFEQLAVAYAIPRACSRSFKFVVPFFPTGTMERVTCEGEIATASTLARMISAVPQSAGGPSQVIIFDIHTLQNQFYFNETVLTRLTSAVELLHHEIRQWQDRMPVAIAFPDEGAHKRFATMFQQWETVICTKVREGDTRIVKLKEGDPVGKHVIIVDDLVQSGGTLIECAKLLKKSGAAKVSAFVSHAIFPGGTWRKFVDVKDGGLAKDPIVSNFFVANTHPTTAQLVGVAPFRVLSIAPLVARLITEGDVDPLDIATQRRMSLSAVEASRRGSMSSLAAAHAASISYAAAGAGAGGAPAVGTLSPSSSAFHLSPSASPSSSPTASSASAAAAAAAALHAGSFSLMSPVALRARSSSGAAAPSTIPPLHPWT